MFVGVDADDDPAGAQAYLDRYGWTWPQIPDPRRELARRLGVAGQPAVVVLDEQGDVVARHLGGGDDAAWEALIARI